MALNYKVFGYTYWDYLKYYTNQIQYIDKIKEYEDELTRLNSKLIEHTKCEIHNIEDFINGNEVNILDYFDAVVKNTVGSVLIISQDKIKIKYIGGMETVKVINSKTPTTTQTKTNNFVPNAWHFVPKVI